MSWVAISSTILPLAGVALGAASTFVGQQMVVRADRRRDAARILADQRAERKEAIIAFLSAAERVEQRRGTPAMTTDDKALPLAELMHNVWLGKKVIELVCSGQLAQAAHDYSRALSPFRDEQGKSKGSGALRPLTPSEERQREQFLEAARREMGYSGSPLQRHGADRTRLKELSHSVAEASRL